MLCVTVTHFIPAEQWGTKNRFSRFFTKWKVSVWMLSIRTNFFDSSRDGYYTHRRKSIQDIVIYQIFTAFHKQLKCFNHECLMPIAHSVLNRLFSMSLPTSCSNPRSKSVAKWYNCLISELVKKIILCRRQNCLLSQHYVGQLRHVCLIVF